MRRFRYLVSDRLVECPFPLSGLLAAEDERPVEFLVALMDRDAREARPDWKGAPVLSLTHDVVDFALPNLLSCGEQIVFHGSLLETEEGCVAALGESGVGKSTLAARWVRAGRRFLSDDWFLLRPEGGRLVAYPSHPSIRLRERDRELARCPGVEEFGPEPDFSKFWYSFGPESAACCSEPRDLRGVALLRRVGNGAGKMRVASPGSRETMAGLVSSLVLLEIDSRERWGFLLPLLARMEASIPMREIFLPESKEDLWDVLKAVEEISRGEGEERGVAFASIGRRADVLRSGLR